MSVTRLQPIVFPASARHTASVIFIHGLGDSGHGWTDAVENWRRRQRLDEVKFILPHAPQIPISANFGMRMPGWYDIAAIDGSVEGFRRNEDEAGIRASQAYFHGLIRAEMEAGIPAERIVLGGFSQGGAMSLFAGLTAPARLGGIVALSSYLLLSLRFAELLPRPELNKETPVLMAHGDADPVVPYRMGVMSYEFLKERGYDVTLKTYPGMGHSACLEEMDEIETFLSKRLPALEATKEPGKSEL